MSKSRHAAAFVCASFARAPSRRQCRTRTRVVHAFDDAQNPGEPVSTTCVHCQAPVGGDTGEIPMRVADARGGDEELWCPQCFVWKRAPLEPHRFHWSAIAAVKCTGCGVVSVDVGRGACAQCSATRVFVLPPK